MCPCVHTYIITLSSHLSSSPLIQLASEYREKKKLTDNLKEDLQIKINEYTKFAEQGELSRVRSIREFYS